MSHWVFCRWLCRPYAVQLQALGSRIAAPVHHKCRHGSHYLVEVRPATKLRPYRFLCSDLLALCSDMLALCSDMLALCSHMLALCSDMLALCSDMLTLRSDMLALCSDILALCSDMLALQ